MPSFLLDCTPYGDGCLHFEIILFFAGNGSKLIGWKWDATHLMTFGPWTADYKNQMKLDSKTSTAPFLIREWISVSSASIAPICDRKGNETAKEDSGGGMVTWNWWPSNLQSPLGHLVEDWSEVIGGGGSCLLKAVQPRLRGSPFFKWKEAEQGITWGWDCEDWEAEAGLFFWPDHQSVPQSSTSLAGRLGGNYGHSLQGILLLPFLPSHRAGLQLPSKRIPKN